MFKGGGKKGSGKKGGGKKGKGKGKEGHGVLAICDDYEHHEFFQGKCLACAIASARFADTFGGVTKQQRRESMQQGTAFSPGYIFLTDLN